MTQNQSSIRPYLEYQADRVEAVLSAHRAPARITGGVVGPRLIRFFLAPAPQTRFAAIRALSDDLALALKTPSLRLEVDREGIVLEFPHPQPRPVTLLPLLREVGPLPLSTVVLGLTEDGTPLLARLSSPEVAHILVAGTTGSGKSALLRTIAASLALTHKPDSLRLLGIDPKQRLFTPLESSSLWLRPPISGVTAAVQALHEAARTMELRDRHGIAAPRIVILIDELADLIFAGGAELTQVLTRLAQRGREAGVHLIAATQRPSAAVLSGLLKANFPLRLVGRVTSPEDARVASGRAGTQAHRLEGRGDFLAVGSGEMLIRFQAAYVEPEELQAALATQK